MARKRYAGLRDRAGWVQRTLSPMFRQLREAQGVCFPRGVEYLAIDRALEGVRGCGEDLLGDSSPLKPELDGSWAYGRPFTLAQVLQRTAAAGAEHLKWRTDGTTPAIARVAVADILCVESLDVTPAAAHAALDELQRVAPGVLDLKVTLAWSTIEDASTPAAERLAAYAVVDLVELARFRSARKLTAEPWSTSLETFNREHGQSLPKALADG